MCDECPNPLPVIAGPHPRGSRDMPGACHCNDLFNEHGVLARELARLQERCTRVMAEKLAEIDALNAQLLRLRAVSIARQSQTAFLADDLARLEAQNAQLRQQLTEAWALRGLGDDADQPAPLAPQHGGAPRQKTILCVGGRNANMPSYREVIEKAGGQFAHHDGGLEDRQGALDDVLAAADLVICQTGCISHNAYWRVKDFCKRTGKQCVFVENPSMSSLSRTLRQISADDLAPGAVAGA